MYTGGDSEYRNIRTRVPPRSPHFHMPLYDTTKFHRRAAHQIEPWPFEELTLVMNRKQTLVPEPSTGAAGGIVGSVAILSLIFEYMPCDGCNDSNGCGCGSSLFVCAPTANITSVHCPSTVQQIITCSLQRRLLRVWTTDFIRAVASMRRRSPTSYKTDGSKKCALAAVKYDGMLLKQLDQKHRNTVDVVMEAVRNNGLALQFAHKSLQNDPPVARAAIFNDARALLYVSRNIQTIWCGNKHSDLKEDKKEYQLTKTTRQ